MYYTDEVEQAVQMQQAAQMQQAVQMQHMQQMQAQTQPPCIYTERAIALIKRRCSSPPPSSCMQQERLQQIKARNEMFRNRLNSLDEIIIDNSSSNSSGDNIKSMDDYNMSMDDQNVDMFVLQEPPKGSVFFAVTKEDLNNKCPMHPLQQLEYISENFPYTVEFCNHLDKFSLKYMDQMCKMTDDELVEDDLQTTSYLIVSELNNLMTDMRHADAHFMQNMPFMNDEGQLIQQQQHV